MSDGPSVSFVLDAQGQEDLLKEALRNVKDHAFRMKRSMDANELSGALKHAAEVLRELRTSLLSPKNYYQLYMQVLDELRHLEVFIEDLYKAGTSIRALYECVQNSGNVLPRLYLLVTVGAIYIKSKEAPAREVLTDLVEMTKGVQHPLRGLFLRHYLSSSVKDKLPDVGSVYEGVGGSTDDAIAFLLQNFSETNRLWIRMQHQKSGIVKDKATREKERQDLRILVSTCLVRLSQMEGVTLTVYTTDVFPKLMEIIVECKDTLAQEYLLDCVIQVFPDAFHVQNLKEMLETMKALQEGVDSSAILITLLERLMKYHDTKPAVELNENTTPNTREVVEREQQSEKNAQKELFTLVMEAVTTLPTATSTLRLYGILTTFTLLYFEAPERVVYMKRVASAALVFVQQPGPSPTSTSTHEQIKSMVLSIVEQLPLAHVRQVEATRELVKLLPWKSTRKYLALEVTKQVVKRKQKVTTTDDVELLLELVAPLVRDDPNDVHTNAMTSDLIQVEFEQLELCKLIHVMEPVADACGFVCLDTTFHMYSVARRAFGQGGVFRIRFTLVPLIYASLKLARDLEVGRRASKKEQKKKKKKMENKEEEEEEQEEEEEEQGPLNQTTAREVLQFVHEMVTALASKVEQMSVTCVNMFLQCALVADRCQFEAIAYEFITQAFIVYEDHITNSREQWKALELMVASVGATRAMSSANYEVLATKTTQYAAKLLKKTDQAAMVLHCAHLFWHPCHQDGKRVLECLQRSLRIADACGEASTGAISAGTGSASPSLTQVPLFLDILEAYVYFYEAKVTEVSMQYVTGLLALVKEHLENMEHGTVRSESETRYRDIRRGFESKGGKDRE